MFAFVSARGFAVNALIEASTFTVGNATVHGTYLTELYVRCGKTMFLHNATNATQWGFGWYAARLDCALGKRHYVHPHTASTCNDTHSTRVEVLYATAYVRCGNWRVRSTVQPVVNYLQGASRNIDLSVGGTGEAHGVLGQNLARPRDANLDHYPQSGVYITHAQAENAIDGVWSDYRVSTPFETFFKYSQFDRPLPTRLLDVNDKVAHEHYVVASIDRK